MRTHLDLTVNHCLPPWRRRYRPLQSTYKKNSVEPSSNAKAPLARFGPWGGRDHSPFLHRKGKMSPTRTKWGDEGRKGEKIFQKTTYMDTTVRWELKKVKAKMGEMWDAFKGKTTRNVDSLVYNIDSPFMNEVISYPFPSKFFMPQLETFDGGRDPLD